MLLAIAGGGGGGRRSVFRWMTDQAMRMQPIRASVVPIEDTPTLQGEVLRALVANGPLTAYQIAERLGIHHDTVRNTLYRLVAMRAVNVVERVPAPRGVARRCVWAVTARREGDVHE